MTYEEFNQIAGKKADCAIYHNEIEPIYMFFGFTKKEIAALYWGTKPGYYDLWLRAVRIYKGVQSATFKNDSISIINAGRAIERLEEAVAALKIG